ncbi:ATP-binding protein [Bradyrhizobium sp. LA2.1]|uniref:AlbA family DNA-binding domain-containing protein n=1 Tax=Bradyrhizobium sp. LA2.1 TaxID=3156376 RepID=UPI003394E7ED
MSILRKPLEAVTVSDLDDLVRVAARETGELEFKGALPFVPIKGQPATADRWIEKGDRIGDYARDQILAEIVAFANADGGTLVLGLHETKEEPRRAERLEPLPRCEDLAKRFLDAMEDVIEPRLPPVSVRALLVSEDGSGYVLMRVGKSLAGPHRLTTTREFYVRRGERSARMSVREITARTLDLARTGDRIEAIFVERNDVAARLYKTLLNDNTVTSADAIMPLLVRVTAIPTTPQDIPDLTRRPELWWTGSGFSAAIDGNNYSCSYPARNFNQQPNVRLRSLVCDVDSRSEGPARLIRTDGLVEFSLIHPRRKPIAGSGSRVYIGWLISLVAGVVAQVERLRHRLAWDAVEYGLEIQIWSTPPVGVFWNDDGFGGGYTMKAEMPLTLPRYSLASGDDYDDLVTTVVRDLMNSCGISSGTICSVPWTELTKRGAA